MSEAAQAFDIEKNTLGGMLRDGPLVIPPYQREYAWKKERVVKLFADIKNAMARNQEYYFLGTIMLTPGQKPAVVDGQQRLATTMIFLSAIRDALLVLSQEKEADSVQADFLEVYDRKQKEHIPRLTLNMDDRDYMKARVLDRPDDRDDKLAPQFHSHRLIDQAANIAAKWVKTIMEGGDTTVRKVEELNAWIEFIDKRAVIIVLLPPNRARAYQMFKTMNDRAQRATQADMIKSHLFEQAEEGQNTEAQSKWTTMRNTIEALAAAQTDDPLLTYLHHVSIALYGPITSDEIFDMMESKVSGRGNAMKFLIALATHATDYAAILTPSHAKWGPYDKRVRACVQQIAQEIKMPFIRPLMLAVAARFSQKETLVAFKDFVSWSLRFLVSGGSRSGTVEHAFGNAARLIMAKQIKTAKDLRAKVMTAIPNDTRFQTAFSHKSISSGRIARFILRELESQCRMQGSSQDALLAPVDDTAILSLEHILPLNQDAEGWDHFSVDEKKTYCNRLGNLALLNNKDNNAVGDKPFAAKITAIKQSQNIYLTANVLAITKKDQKWTIDTIKVRQKGMAGLALKRWPRESS